ncbi:3-hexulose-6-phosphate synthase [Fictibacillus phosphorivorans]|uniref:3-hexulose-6-phosphate synthase n=1 Tax=Fictibacillus phosphorivorans TaxID=1221500 RepID=UPI00203A91B0|nr:3-hexulose-6-phosphate synthase [Fictibacillus phosphorivorans]MCM3719014.1 orotidine 5'-phosphate decarboxylase [Fictibacillus phosphorivorans]MCM3776636.1 orotidine 5'-phosphate decarboxylase [Fictibacillus phosphorivorans]
MMIQLALDRLSIEEAINVTRKVEHHIDWIEVGTSLIKEFGMDSVRKMKSAFPDKTIVADIKTFDNAIYEFELCFKNGADVATVMGAAPKVSIEACRDVAKRYNKQVMIDLLNTTDEQFAYLSEYEDLVLCAHISKDEQEHGGKTGWTLPLTSNENVMWAVAGGISPDSFSEIMKLNPHVVIIGSGITKAEDPEKAAKFFSENARVKGLNL